MDAQAALAQQFKKSPVLKCIVDEHGDRSVAEYFAKTIPGRSAAPEDRQNEFLAVVGEQVARLIDPTVAESAIAELRHHYGASTADHHGPVTHPFFSHGNLVRSLTMREKGAHTILVLACGGVSMSNSSFPRGLIFHDDALTEHRLTFAGWRHRRAPVYGFPAYRREHIETIEREQIQQIPRQATREQLVELLHSVYGTEEVLAERYYADQVVRTNYALWKRIPGEEHASLVYLQMEDVVNQLLLAYHLNADTLVTRLLTDEDFLKAFERMFDGVRGAFSSHTGMGTTLFWGTSGDRRSLRRNGMELVDGAGSVAVELNSAALAEALNEKRIMPSMALSFIVLAFYYGVQCGGGFGQVTYLGDVRRAYTDILSALGIRGEEFCNDVETSTLSADILVSYLQNEKGRVPATGLDFALRRGTWTPEMFQSQARSTTLSDSIAQMLECYTL